MIAQVGGIQTVVDGTQQISGSGLMEQTITSIQKVIAQIHNYDNIRLRMAPPTAEGGGRRAISFLSRNATNPFVKSYKLF